MCGFHLIFILTLLFAEKLSTTTCNNHRVYKRSLLFPQYTVLQFTYGVTAPVILPKRSINLSLCVQINYEPPFNITQLQPMIVSARSEEEDDFDLDRRTFYEFIIRLLDSINFDGKSCLLRSICEIAEIPMHVEDTNSLLENIVHYLFTPSEEYVSSSFEAGFRNESVSDEFLAAEIAGKTVGKCYKQFPRCQFSLPDLFTKMFVLQ